MDDARRELGVLEHTPEKRARTYRLRKRNAHDAREGRPHGRRRYVVRGLARSAQRADAVEQAPDDGLAGDRLPLAQDPIRDKIRDVQYQ